MSKSTGKLVDLVAVMGGHVSKERINEGKSCKAIKIRHAGGYVDEFDRPVKTQDVMKLYAQHWVTRPDVFRATHSHLSVLPPEAPLKPGQTYFLVPFRTLYSRLIRQAIPKSDHLAFLTQQGLCPAEFQTHLKLKPKYHSLSRVASRTKRGKGLSHHNHHQSKAPSDHDLPLISRTYDANYRKNTPVDHDSPLHLDHNHAANAPMHHVNRKKRLQGLSDQVSNKSLHSINHTSSGTNNQHKASLNKKINHDFNATHQKKSSKKDTKDHIYAADHQKRVPDILNYDQICNNHGVNHQKRASNTPLHLRDVQYCYENASHGSAYCNMAVNKGALSNLKKKGSITPKSAEERLDQIVTQLGSSKSDPLDETLQKSVTKAFSANHHHDHNPCQQQQDTSSPKSDPLDEALKQSVTESSAAHHHHPQQRQDAAKNHECKAEHFPPTQLVELHKCHRMRIPKDTMERELMRATQHHISRNVLNRKPLVSMQGKQNNSKASKNKISFIAPRTMTSHVADTVESGQTGEQVADTVRLGQTGEHVADIVKSGQTYAHVVDIVESRATEEHAADIVKSRQTDAYVADIVESRQTCPYVADIVKSAQKEEHIANIVKSEETEEHADISANKPKFLVNVTLESSQQEVGQKCPKRLDKNAFDCVKSLEQNALKALEKQASPKFTKEQETPKIVTIQEPLLCEKQYTLEAFIKPDASMIMPPLEPKKSEALKLRSVPERPPLLMHPPCLLRSRSVQDHSEMLRTNRVDQLIMNFESNQNDVLALIRKADNLLTFMTRKQQSEKSRQLFSFIGEIKLKTQIIHKKPWSLRELLMLSPLQMIRRESDCDSIQVHDDTSQENTDASCDLERVVDQEKTDANSDLERVVDETQPLPSPPTEVCHRQQMTSTRTFHGRPRRGHTKSCPRWEPSLKPIYEYSSS